MLSVLILCIGCDISQWRDIYLTMLHVNLSKDIFFMFQIDVKITEIVYK